MALWPQSRLGTVLNKLERHYGVPVKPKLNGPFEMIVWEIVAYLAGDATRESAFRMLREKWV